MTLINNTATPAAANPITGTFVNLPDGRVPHTRYSGTPYIFHVNYAGGDGNDLVLTVVPAVAGIALNTLTVTDANLGTAMFEVRVTYNEVMNTGVNPVVTFSPAVATTLTYDPAWSWWTSSTTFLARFDVGDAGVEVPHVGIGVSGRRMSPGTCRAPTAARTTSASTRSPRRRRWSAQCRTGRA